MSQLESSSAAPSLKSSRLAKLGLRQAPLLAVVALTLLGMGAALLTFLMWNYSKVESLERDRLAGDTLLIVGNISRQIEGTNLLLALARDEVSRALEKPNSGRVITERLKLLTTGLKGVRTALVVDRSGHVIASNRAQLVGVNFRDNERYLTISRTPDASLLYVSAPFKTPLGIWSIGLARMISDAQGRFNGYVMVVLEPQYFEELLQAALYAPDMRAAVIHGDGKFLIQVPPLGAAGLDVSQDPSSAAMRHLRSKQKITVIETVTVADRQRRLVASGSVNPAAARMDKLLVVGLTREVSAIFADWRHSAVLGSSLYGVVLVMAGLCVWLSRRRDLELAQSDAALRRAQEGAEQTLQEVEQRWRAALEASAKAVWDWDMERGRILFAPAHEKMLGYRLQELGDRPGVALSLVHPDDRAALELAFGKNARDRLDSHHGEYRVRHKNGHYVWLESHALIIERTADGTGRRMVGTHRDISGRKRLEQKLIASNQQLVGMRMALENAGTAMYFANASDWRFRSVNQAAATMLGYTREGLHALSLTAIDADGNSAEKFARTLQEARIQDDLRVETVQRRKDGTCLAVELSFYRLPQTTDTLLILGVNITARKAAENEIRQAKSAAEAASLAKTAFLATISHEIRTPLNGLAGMLDLLGNTKLDVDAREFLDIASTAARQLRAILNDVLDLSKVEAGKLEFEQVPFDVQEQLGNAVRAFTGAARAKGLQLKIDCNVSAQMLLGDPQRICQIVSNLVDNAIKFTDQGGVEVQVVAHEATDGDDRCDLQVSVSDTGVGVPAEREGAIFEAFTQAEQSTSRRFGGTGLGLTLCRQLCRGMGGDIRFDRRPSGGSVLTFTIPCELAHGISPFADTQPAELADEETLSGRRALVVDDNRVNQTLLKRWLAKENMEVVLAADGADGVHAVVQGKFDIVLMDVSMPVMNGLDATRAIRALASPGTRETQAYARLPIIGISANAMLGDRQNCLECGMTDYVTKPIDRMELLGKIARALSVTR